MLFKKVRYSLSVVLRETAHTAREIGLSWRYLSLIVLSIGLIVYLSLSIYRVVVRGKENYQVIAEESIKLNKLQAEGRALAEEVEYIKSLEFKENYARNSLNYARPEQELYYVKREVRIDYEYLEKNKDPIILNNNKDWWKKILVEFN